LRLGKIGAVCAREVSRFARNSRDWQQNKILEIIHHHVFPGGRRFPKGGGGLTPGRIIDLNERAMRHFDPSLRLGVIYGVRVRPLSGDYWIPGPVG
jgi:hypothetical protein